MADSIPVPPIDTTATAVLAATADWGWREGGTALVGSVLPPAHLLVGRAAGGTSLDMKREMKGTSVCFVRVFVCSSSSTDPLTRTALQLQLFLSSLLLFFFFFLFFFEDFISSLCCCCGGGVDQEEQLSNKIYIYIEKKRRSGDKHKAEWGGSMAHGSPLLFVFVVVVYAHTEVGGGSSSVHHTSSSCHTASKCSAAGISSHLVIYIYIYIYIYIVFLLSKIWRFFPPLCYLKDERFIVLYVIYFFLEGAPYRLWLYRGVVVVVAREEGEQKK
eukprot:gene3765-2656_t